MNGHTPIKRLKSFHDSPLLKCFRRPFAWNILYLFHTFINYKFKESIIKKILKRLKISHFKSIPFIFTKSKYHLPQNQSNSKSLPSHSSIYIPEKVPTPLFCPVSVSFSQMIDCIYYVAFDARVYIEVIKAYIHLSSSQKYQNQYINKRMPDTERSSMLLHKCCPDYNMYEILNSFLQ